MALTPSGPTVKFHATNIHTMDELKLTGNCLKGSRPLLSFDSAFDQSAHLAVCKEVFMQVWGTPKYHPRSKPFFDHIFQFSVFENRIWFRHFQIVVTEVQRQEHTQMIEIGPRFVLDPIRIFSSGFGGATLYKNPDFVSPNAIRSFLLQKTAQSYRQRKDTQLQSNEYRKSLEMPRDPVKNLFRDAARSSQTTPQEWDDEE